MGRGNSSDRYGWPPPLLHSAPSPMMFGFVKNGGFNAECIILFRTEIADEIAVRRKRAGHLLSKGRFLAAQILAMLEGGVGSKRHGRIAVQELPQVLEGKVMRDAPRGARTGVLLLALALAAAFLVPACASSRNSSEREWERGQCAQVVDREAREKCMDRVDAEYGKR